MAQRAVLWASCSYEQLISSTSEHVMSLQLPEALRARSPKIHMHLHLVSALTYSAEGWVTQVPPAVRHSSAAVAMLPVGAPPPLQGWAPAELTLQEGATGAACSCHHDFVSSIGVLARAFWSKTNCTSGQLVLTQWSAAHAADLVLGQLC